MARWADSFFEGVDTFFAWLSTSLKQTTESYCDLETADSSTVLVNHDGSLISIIEIDGVTALAGADEYESVVEGLTNALQTGMGRPGHALQVYFSHDKQNIKKVIKSENEFMMYDLIVVGSGAAGLSGAIKAGRNGKKVLILEKLSQIATKLKATGGGRCNLSNTLDNTTFMQSFGKNGRFMTTALNQMDHTGLRDFFTSLDVPTHIPDGFRIFPVTHSSTTIINALSQELQRLNIEVICEQKVEDIIISDNAVSSIQTQDNLYKTKNILLATGGMGYPKMGATGDGFKIVEKLGHSVSKLYPAMMPLSTKDTWQGNCRADTISKVTIKVNIPNNNKLKKLTAKGDLIFTSTGLRGPVILDFAREITPYLDTHKEVPILVNLTHGMNEDDIIKIIKEKSIKEPNKNILEILSYIIPNSLAIEFCKICTIDTKLNYKHINGKSKNNLIKLLAWTPFTITGHDGFNKAMITRGGINLKEIDSNTMQSKIINGLYFAGEIVDVDGPCGGYNLQWSFSSGYLAGELLSTL
jgi:predicted Rossmann fold flavoprotein